MGRVNYLRIFIFNLEGKTKEFLDLVKLKDMEEFRWEERHQATFEHLLQELRFGKDEQMKLICDNQTALHISSNPVFHEMTKLIKVDYHFIRENIASGGMTTSFVNCNDQLANIFTKSLRGHWIKCMYDQLGAFDLYAPA